MARITIGQYYPADSMVHSLDPRVKILGTILYVAMLLAVPTPIGYAAAAFFLVLTIWLSKVPPLMVARGLRAVLVILVFIAATNLFLTTSGDVLVSFGFVRITMGGLQASFQMVARLVLLMCGSSVLTLTTSPIQLTDGIEFLLSPLKKIKVPAHDIAMMMTIALRFVPTLAEEMEKITRAQKARGADFDTGGIVKRARSLLPVLVPLFISAFKRAEELAVAMEARCYRGDVGRTKYKEMRMKRADWLATGVLLAYVGGLLFLG